MGVEPLGDVAGDFDVLALVVADRDLVGVVQQDVGRLECGVREQAGRDKVVLIALVLELCHAAEFAEAHVALHQPRQFGVFSNVRLNEERADVGIEPDRHQHLRESD